MSSAYVKDFYDPSKNAANYKIGLYPADVWTQDYARKALRTEMRLEKALEGERYFDLVRSGFAPTVLVPDQYGYRTNSWTENKKHIPLAQSELDADPSLKPNNY